MLAKTLRYPRLLHAFIPDITVNPPPLPPPASASKPAATVPGQEEVENHVNISVMKRRGKKEDEEMTQLNWIDLSEQFVFQLYFYVAKTYQSIIYNLEHKNLPFLFQKLDEKFINNDTMIIEE